MAVRNNINDFIRDVAAQGKNANATSPNLYVATLNADNTTVTIKKNGVALFSKVYWAVQGSAALTDAGGNANEDTVTIVDGGGFPVPGSAQALLNTLT